MPRRRSRLATATAFGVTAALVAFGGTLPANAAAGDQSEAEARLVTLTGLAQAVALDGAYTAYAPGGTDDPTRLDGPVSASVLQQLATARVSAGVTLGSVLDLSGVRAGADRQVSTSGTAGATAAAGAVTDSGAVAVNGGTGQAARLDLQPTLQAAGVAGVLSDLDLRIGALGATATDAGAAAPTSSYGIASADATITSPVIQGLRANLVGVVDGVSAGLSTRAVVSPATLGLLDGILTRALGVPLLDTTNATADLRTTVDAQAAVDAVLSQPLTSGAVTIDIRTGTLTLDLDAIQTLDGQPANTRVLTTAVLTQAVNAALTDILTRQLPDRLLEAVLDSTAVALTIRTDIGTPRLSVLVPAVDLGDVVITTNTTLANLVNPTGPGNSAPVISTAGTALLPPLTLTTALTESLVSGLTTGLLPALATDLGGAVSRASVVTGLTNATGAVLTAVAPVLAAVDSVVRLTVNAQDRPGDFTDADGLDAGSFTVSALRIGLLPTAGGPTVSLASATVRADAAVVGPVQPVAITSPDPAQAFPAGTTTVAVEGTAEPGAEVDVTVGNQTLTSTATTAGRYRVLFANLPSGTFTASARQRVGGEQTGLPTSVTFAIAAPAADADTADADVLDLDGLDLLDADAADLDALDLDVVDAVDALDVDTTDLDGTDVDTIDTDADVLDVVDVADVVVDAGADVIDAGDVLDVDGGLDVLDTDAADLDALDIDVVDVVDALDVDTTDLDGTDADTVDTDADVLDVVDVADVVVDAGADVIDAGDVLDIDGGLDVLDTDAADLDALDIDVVDVVDALDVDTTDLDGTDADTIDTDADVLDVVDVADVVVDAGADVIDAGDVLDVDGGLDALDTDAADLDALDVDVVDVVDALDVDTTDLDGTDVDTIDTDADVLDVVDVADVVVDAGADVIDAGDVLDVDGGLDVLDADAADLDALDLDVVDVVDALDVDTTDLDGTDADTIDTDADVLDVVDVADVVVDAGADVIDAGDVLDVDGGLDVLDADAADLDALDIDVVDVVDALDVDTTDLDGTDADTIDTDADVLDVVDVADVVVDAGADVIDAGDVLDVDGGLDVL
ncbi:choice-of-anchor G family protein, partial [Clavibacter michiganensis]|uniref:choice-of-anchor G family protein n=1 Tax=Clavibacter michiganensis TaxID=28447 RepID=UPI001BDF8BE2